MRAADLTAALEIVRSRAANVALRDRLASGEGLSLLVGQGSEASRIELSAGFRDTIRKTLIDAFERRIADNDAALASMGIEP